MRSTVLGLLALALMACGDPAPSPPPVTGAWEAQEVLSTTAKIGGVAIGDVDARHTGNEIVAVTGDGEVWIVFREAGAWKGERAADLPGEMIQCAIGDADLTRPGLEIVAVGMAEGTEDDGGLGSAWLIHSSQAGWTQTLLCQDAALIHGVAILPGTVVVVGFSHHATRVRKAQDGWSTLRLADLGAPGKIAIPYEDTVLVGCADGAIWQIQDLESGETILRARGAAGQSRLGSEGTRILAAGDDGQLSLVVDGQLEAIHRESTKLRGAVLAELDPGSEGAEAATAGYSGRVTVLRQTELGGRHRHWQPEVIYEGGERLHHLAAGELDGEGIGLELVTCGYSRKVIVLRRRAAR